MPSYVAYRPEYDQDASAWDGLLAHVEVGVSGAGDVAMSRSLLDAGPEVPI